jgi:iron-sulfur cluster repair protein YtfE (RIC family)
MTNQAFSVFFPAAVRGRILEQHDALRELLRQSLDATTRAFLPGGPGGDELSRLVHELRARFRAHLTFEERALLPILAQVDTWGPERVSSLLEEHSRQRAELETLVDGIVNRWDEQRLAFALRSLVTDLLLDMEDEERGCLAIEGLNVDVAIAGPRD